MLEFLRERERTMLELAEPFDMSQPAVSQHLAVLHESGLVSARAEGRTRIYRIEPENLRAVNEWLKHYRHFWTSKLWALGEFLDGTPQRSKKGRKKQ